MIVAGMAHTLFLLSAIDDEVFYSGDAGVKALWTDQFADGRFSVALRLRAEPWVSDLWEKGLYPLRPPFVYDQPAGRVVQYPFLFPLLTAPFYRLIGFRGLYVIPALSLWALWFRLRSLCTRCGLGPRETSLALAGLILATPMSLYGAMFWEHTLGALLVFLGFEHIVRAHIREPHRGIAFSYGLLTGMSVWVRSESWCMLGAVVLLVALSRFAGNPLPRSRQFMAGLAVPAVLLLALNTFLYSTLLGAHSYQMIGQERITTRTTLAATVFVDLAIHTVLSTPMSSSVALYLIFIHRRLRSRLALIGSRTAFLWVTFVVVVPLVLPCAGGKQWGARFLLIVVPHICFLSGIGLSALLQLRSRVVRWGGVVLVAACLTSGTWWNSYRGTRELRNDYRYRVLPTLRALRRSDVRPVAVMGPFMAQELASAFKTKAFFLVQTPEQLEHFLNGMVNADESRFLFVEYARHDSPGELTLPLAHERVSCARLVKLSQGGAYAVYGGRLISK